MKVTIVFSGGFFYIPDFAGDIDFIDAIRYTVYRLSPSAITEYGEVSIKNPGGHDGMGYAIFVNGSLFVDGLNRDVAHEIVAYVAFLSTGDFEPELGFECGEDFFVAYNGLKQSDLGLAGDADCLDLGDDFPNDVQKYGRADWKYLPIAHSIINYAKDTERRF